jgi:hypothetical protein
MAIAVISQTTLTLSGSEQTIGSAITTGKTAVVQIDLNPMAAGDVVEVYCYVKTAGSGGTARLLFRQGFSDVQSGCPVYQSIPVCAPYSVEFKAMQPTGTARTVDFCLMTID